MDYEFQLALALSISEYTDNRSTGGGADASMGANASTTALDDVVHARHNVAVLNGFRELLEQLREVDVDGLFDLELVRKAKGVPSDYFDVVREPMDFVKIERKLREFAYRETIQFKVCNFCVRMYMLQ